MTFLQSLVSKKLAVTAAAAALVSSLPMTADQKGICIAAIAFAYVLGQAYVDAAPEDPPKPPPVVRLGGVSYTEHPIPPEPDDGAVPARDP